ncbi:IucA/IucC family C-terminal-domain containing protein [Bacillus taeanensis]|nr:IucA/IucC family C-terminal-domain containing protein [Bacillus taeanensis]
MTTAIFSTLNRKELTYLETNFRYSNQHSAEMISAVKLLDEELLLSNLNSLSAQLSARSLITAASQFSKHYAFLLTTVSLYAMTMWNKGMDLSLENILLEFPNSNNKSFPTININDLKALTSSECNRQTWRDAVIKHVFFENLSKVWKSLNAVSKVPMPILWENTAVYIFWLYETKMKEEVADRETRLQIREDFHYLIKEASGELFGETENPLTKFYTKKCTLSCSEDPVRVRKTCCLYYQLTDKENRGYCKTCPKQQ